MTNLRAVLITKSLIASIVGTTTETAIRTLSRWKKAGLISSERGKITIENVDGICQIAELDLGDTIPHDITIGFSV